MQPHSQAQSWTASLAVFLHKHSSKTNVKHAASKVTSKGTWIKSKALATVRLLHSGQASCSSLEILLHGSTLLSHIIHPNCLSSKVLSPAETGTTCWLALLTSLKASAGGAQSVCASKELLLIAFEFVRIA